MFPAGLGIGDRQVDDLADLPPRGVIDRPELQAAPAATVTGDDALVVCGLYVSVESLGVRHVVERGSGRGVDGPALGKHDYLGQLPPGDVVPRPERPIPVTGDNPLVVS